MAYRQSRPPVLETLDDVIGFIQQEYGLIEGAFNETEVLELRDTSQFPTKPRDGIIFYAKTPLNPGYGDGPYVFSNGVWKPLIGRGLLTANKSYFVATTGNDSNPGTASLPFRNIQTGINAAALNDLGNFFLVGVQVAPGTYFETVSLPSYVGSGPIVVTGSPGTPGNTIIDASGLGNPFPIFANQNLSQYAFNGFKLKTSAGGNCVLAAQNGRVQLANIEFDTAGVHIQCHSRSLVQLTGSTKMTADPNFHWLVDTGGSIITNGTTLNVTGRAVGITFARVTNGGLLDIPAMTFIGTATGKRFDVDGAGVIHTGTNATNPATSNYIPGNSPGTVTSPGFYS